MSAGRSQTSRAGLLPNDGDLAGKAVRPTCPACRSDWTSSKPASGGLSPARLRMGKQLAGFPCPSVLMCCTGRSPISKGARGCAGIPAVAGLSSGELDNERYRCRRCSRYSGITDHGGEVSRALGTVGGLLLAATFTLFGFFGEIFVTLEVAIHAVSEQQGAEAFFWVSLILVVLVVAIYAYRSLKDMILYPIFRASRSALSRPLSRLHPTGRPAQPCRSCSYM